MIIALDSTYSTGQALSGVGVYSREILSHLAQMHPGQRFLWCYRPHRLLAGLRQPRPANARVRPLLERVQVFGAGLFHGLNQRLPATRFARRVSTFHDLFVFTASYSTPGFRARFAAQAREAAARSDLIICVSAFTASQVEDILGVPAARIRVVPHGVHLPAAGVAGPREPLILHVGAIQQRKNVLRLVSAFERAAPPPWRLVLAGGDGFGAALIHDRIRASRAASRIETPGWLPAPELEALYRRASIFAFPSLDEGFGIPVLEAMAYGLPVLASNRSALPEACGDAAVLIDPLREDEIAQALSTLIANPAWRESLAAAGRERAGRFSWQRAAEATWAVYRELCGRAL